MMIEPNIRKYILLGIAIVLPTFVIIWNYKQDPKMGIYYACFILMCVAVGLFNDYRRKRKQSDKLK